MLKAVILIGGPQKGTRFRPLSLELPKPLFPVAGFPIIYHHIEACLKLPDIKEVLLIGAYQPSEALNRFISTTQRELNISLRYLQEYTTLGTAGGLYHFRDQILTGKPEGFFVFNGDICCDFPMVEMWNFHRQVEGNGKHFTMLATQATRKQSLQYGCLVENEETHEVLHYVEKPQTFVSSSINCGVYIFTPEIFTHIGAVFLQNQADVFNGGDYINPVRDCIRLEQDILSPLAGTKKLFVFQSTRFWSQIKSAGSAIYANRLYLSLFRSTHPERLARNNDNSPKIIGDVFIHPTALVDSTATLGPNVTVGAGATVGPGVRIKESLILEGALLQDHSCILHSIIGWNSSVGAWSRVEGTANDPNPNDKHAKIDSSTLFNEEGKLNPSITILGRNVVIPSEVMVLNAILLPDKELSGTFKNQILL